MCIATVVATGCLAVFGMGVATSATPKPATGWRLQLIDANGNLIATPSTPVGGNEFNDCAWARSCATT